MRAATQAAGLQVVAAREQLDVRKALRQLVVIPLRYSLVCNGKCALTANATFVKHRSHGAHFLFPVKWERCYKSYLEEAVPLWRPTQREAAPLSAVRL